MPRSRQGLRQGQKIYHAGRWVSLVWYRENIDPALPKAREPRLVVRSRPTAKNRPRSCFAARAVLTVGYYAKVSTPP